MTSELKAGIRSAAGLGVGASGSKEVLDWLLGFVRYRDPYLYELLQLEPVDAAIMAMITTFFCWLGVRQK